MTVPQANVASLAFERSFAYKSTIVHNGYAGAAANTASEDPANRAARNEFQYDPLTGGSGLGNVYINAEWLFKMSDVHEAPCVWARCASSPVWM